MMNETFDLVSLLAAIIFGCVIGVYITLKMLIMMPALIFVAAGVIAALIIVSFVSVANKEAIEDERKELDI